MNLKRLILDGEGVTLDFKQTITNCEKIAKTMVSFANNRGGKLLIGVANDGKIVGVKSEEEEKFMILKAAHLYCKPALDPIFEEIYVDDKIVLQVEIKQSTLRPHYALAEDKTWWAYIRLKDKSVLANEIVIDVLKQENNDQEIYQKYVSKEKELLKYLQTNSRITTEEYSAILNLSHRRTRCILVSLVLSGIIELHATEKELFFTAS
jgi:predicted HTH transcriptional regulator